LKDHQKVSVIIPTWNRAETIKLAIDSVLAQTHPVWEILVCDDGSTDATKKLISEYKTNKVIWIDGKHSGLPSAARNRGLTQATGSYIAFLDSDDEWHPSKLKRQLEIMDTNQTKASASNAARFVNGLENGCLLDFSKDLIKIDDLLIANNLVCSSVIFARGLLKNIGYFPENQELTVGEDYTYWLRLLMFTHISYINDCLVNYRDHPSESIRKNSPSPISLKSRVFGNFFYWLILNYKSVFLKILVKFTIANLVNFSTKLINESDKFKAFSISFLKKMIEVLFCEALKFITLFFKTKYFLTKTFDFFYMKLSAVIKKLL